MAGCNSFYLLCMGTIIARCYALVRDALINPSFRAKRSVDPESSCVFSICYWRFATLILRPVVTLGGVVPWIPACADEKDELIRLSLGDVSVILQILLTGSQRNPSLSAIHQARRDEAAQYQGTSSCPPHVQASASLD